MPKRLNLFYEQPTELDRRRLEVFLQRRTSPWQATGQMRFFMNLCAGLDEIGTPYSVNDYEYIEGHPDEVASIIGKEMVLNKLRWKNPILYGPNVYDHPSDDPNLLQRLPIRRILVSAEWYRRMCEPAWGDLLTVWASGIETERWSPEPDAARDIDLLLYDKVLWDYGQREKDLIGPIRAELAARGLRTAEVRYDYYREEDYRSLLRRSRAMIFLSAHESFGFARLHAQSCDVPVLAWDPGGFWPDPNYFPHKVRFAPVTSVPDWDGRCGVKFRTAGEFAEKLDEFLGALRRGEFAPRDFVMEHFTLRKKAREYVEIVESVEASEASA